MKVKENTEAFEVLENIEQLHHMEQMKNDESKQKKNRCIWTILDIKIFKE